MSIRGGVDLLIDSTGADATERFEAIGHSMNARKELEKYRIGVLYLSEEERKRKIMEMEAKRLAAANKSSLPQILVGAAVAIMLGSFKYWYVDGLISGH